MIKYKCRDIVNMALSLADLTNSSFITYADNYKFLNDAYMKLYQKMIDSGEKYFLKTMSITNSGSSSIESYYDLPEDFYQLYSVYITPTCVPISRKSKNEPKSSQRYDIINGKLVIYGNISDNLEVQYYPIPETVTSSAEPVEVGITDSISYLCDCNGQNYLYVKLGEVYATIYNADTNSATSLTGLPSPGANNSLILGSTAILSRVREGTSYKSYSISSNVQSEISTSTGIVCSTFKYEGEPAITLVNSTGGAVTFIVNDASLILPNITVPAEETSVITNGSTVIYTTSEGTFFIDEENNTVKVSDMVFDIIDVYNGDYYLYQRSQLRTLYTFDGVTLTKIGGPFNKYFGINKVSADTGYGYTSYINGGYYVNSIFPNVLLNYPNTSLYTLMAYYLAILYCTKQGKDTALLETAAARQEAQYFDMLNKDANMNYRITNAYAASSY